MRHVRKRQVPDQGVAATMEVLYDLETALVNTTAVIEDFAEASTADSLLSITLNGTQPDESSVNNTLDQIEDGTNVSVISILGIFQKAMLQPGIMVH